MHSGVMSLCIAARQFGVDLSADRLVHDHDLGAEEPAPERLAIIGRGAGLKVRVFETSLDRLSKRLTGWPLLARTRDGRYLVFIGFDKGQIRAFDPQRPQASVELYDEARLAAQWSGVCLELQTGRRAAATEEQSRFGVGTFFAEIGRLRGLFGQIALMAMVMHGLSLAGPIFFQVVTDKVLQSGSLPTLHVLTIGMILLLLLNAVFGYCRSLLLNHATARIDVRLATRVFARLLSLPLGYFESRSAGVIAKHAGQYAAIRKFLSGKLFTTVLDLAALVVFIPVLAAYSGIMTLIVLGFALLIGLVMLAVMRPYRRRLNQLYEAEGARQALLIETLQGIETTKALALEPQRRTLWDGLAARSVNGAFEVGSITALSGEITRLLEKLMSVALIFVGVNLILSGQISIGVLVAFNMLASRVSGPLVQLVSLIQEYQEIRVSLTMLGEVMNGPAERPAARGLTPRLKGGLAAEGVSFRYPMGAQALSGIDFQIRPGELVGIVGRSGSGKSTLIKLLQGFHMPTEGVLRIDGLDSRQFDLTHLRLSTSVVPQTCFLYRGTVRENIAVTRPGAAFEEIVMAARMAGAERFIEGLPQGFDTPLNDGGSNLSGGQRQRIALARALLRDPRLLILDEATSALDPESEMTVMENLAAIRKGRTLVMVTHRLGQLVDADRIIVMDAGRIIAIGDHRGLLSACDLYRDLWNKQYGRLTDSTRPAA